MNKSQYLEVRNQTELQSVSFGYRAVTLLNEADLAAAQVGYSVDAEQRSLTGSEEGDWKATWLVIANEDQCDDPIFTDLAAEELPVYTAMHGQGEWQPELIADSFGGFIQILEMIQTIATGRGNPVELEANPLPVDEAQAVLARIAQVNPKSTADFWEGWLAE